MPPMYISRIVNSLVAVRGIFTVAFWLLLWQVGNWTDDLKSLIWELSNADKEIKTTSAWVLPRANQNNVIIKKSQNNVLVQNQVLCSLTSLQLFSMVIPLSFTSSLTAYSRNYFPLFQCIPL